MFCIAPVKGSSLYGPLLQRRLVRFGANVSVGLWLRDGDEWAPGRVVVHPLHFPIVAASALLRLRKGFISQRNAKLPPWHNGGIVLQGTRCPQKLLPSGFAEPRELVLCVLCSSGRPTEQFLEVGGTRARHRDQLLVPVLEAAALGLQRLEGGPDKLREADLACGRIVVLAARPPCHVVP